MRQFVMVVIALVTCARTRRLSVPISPIRMCEKIQLVPGSQVVFQDLPEAISDRVLLPFTLELLEDFHEVHMFLGHGTEDDKNGDVVYRLAFHQDGAQLDKMKIDEGSVQVIQKIRRDILPKLGTRKGLLFRMKITEDSIVFGLYDPDEDIRDPFMVASEELDEPERVPIQFGFAVVKDELPGEVDNGYAVQANINVAAIITWNCRSPLGVSCIHDVECLMTPGSRCSRSEKKCICDDGRYPVANNSRCKSLDIKLGDVCQSSRDCAKLEAKCRLQNRFSQIKVCKCFSNQIVEHGLCLDAPDKMKLDFQNQTMPEMVYSAKEHYRSASSKRCNIHQNVNQASFDARQWLIPFNRNGFEVRFYAQGTGTLVLKFLANYVFDESVMTVVFREKEVAVKLKSNELPFSRRLNETVINGDNPNEIIVLVKCNHVQSSFCNLQISNEIKNQTIISIKMANLWLQSVQPMYYTFFPGSSDTDIQIVSQCNL